MTKKGQHRLFFALNFSESFKQALFNWQLSLDIQGKLIDPDNFHLTLLFLGAIKNHQVYDIIDSIQVPEQKSFTLTTGALNFFAKTEILYAAIEQGHDATLALHQYLKQQTSQLNFLKREKRNYVPHITFAREVQPPTSFPDAMDIDEHISDFQLMESIQIKSGVVYETIDSWRLSTPTVKQQLLGR